MIAAAARYSYRLGASAFQRAASAVRSTWRISRVRRKLRRHDQPFKVHIGCGGVRFPGWVHIDSAYWRDRRDRELIIWDLRDGIPLANESCQFIYSEHFVEHLPVADGVRYFRECFRVLQSGGVVRTAMPDLHECVRQYWENDWRQPWMQQYGYEWIQTRAECLNIAMRDWQHQWLYDREELIRRLTDAGFHDIYSEQIGKSKHEELVGLESRSESLLVCEAVKGIRG